MDDMVKNKYFEIVSSTAIGSIGGLFVSAAYEIAAKSVVSKQLSLPTGGEIAKASFVTVPLAGAISGYGAYREFLAQHPQAHQRV